MDLKFIDCNIRYICLLFNLINVQIIATVLHKRSVWNAFKT